MGERGRETSWRSCLTDGERRKRNLGLLYWPVGRSVAASDRVTFGQRTHVAGHMMASSSTALAAVLVPGAGVTSERPSRARWPSHPVGSAVKCSHGCSLGAEHSTRRSPHTVPRPVHLPTRRHHAWSQHPILSLLAGHQHRPRVHVDSSWATCAERLAGAPLWRSRPP